MCIDQFVTLVVEFNHIPTPRRVEIQYVVKDEKHPTIFSAQLAQYLITLAMMVRFSTL